MNTDPKPGFRLTRLEDYAPLIGRASVARIGQKARALRGARVAHVNSTYYGGGVAEILGPLTLLMNALGIATDWRVMRGSAEFFEFTRAMHDALQGRAVDPAPRGARAYEQVLYENALRNRLDECDLVVVHDPQPAALIRHYAKRAPWIWRCHVDLSAPHPGAWQYLAQFVERYDAVVLSCPEYARDLRVAQHFFFPAIDPFSPKNRPLGARDIDERLARYGIPTDLPLVVQVSRFDRWKDPEGVIDAFQLARRKAPATLVLLGNFASDDPQGEEVFKALMRRREERVLILPHGDDTLLVNALQRRAAVVLQKSLREGFGLTVTEAMWKGRPVIGGAAGGIRHQIDDGENGFLVASIEQAAERMVELLRDAGLRARLGRAAKEKARQNFLLTRYLEQYLDLFASLRGAGRAQRLPRAA